VVCSVISSSWMTQTQRTLPSCSLSNDDALGRIRRDNDGQPVLIVEHEVQKLGQHLLRLSLLQHDQGQFLVAHLRRFSWCHALP
jgi:hypothetical protein